MNDLDKTVIEIKSDDLKNVIIVKDNALNSIGFFLQITFINFDKIKSDEIEKQKFKRELREFLLDLKDSIYAVELELPVIAVFDNVQDDNIFDFIHELAGDQDWHRGDFSIVVSKKSIFKDVIKKTIPFDTKITFNELSFNDIATHIFEQIENIKENDKEFEKLYKAFLKSIADSIKNGKIEEGFNYWREQIENKLKELEYVNDK